MSSKSRRQQPAPKHAKPEVTKITREEYVKEWDNLCEEFHAWRDSVELIIDTQQKNLYRADAFMMTINQVLESPMAKTVAKGSDGSNLWAFGFAKKVQNHIAETLGKLKDIFHKYTVGDALNVGRGEVDDPIFLMIPYIDKEQATLESVWWGDITYQTIRPYGEKLSDTAKKLVEEVNALDARLDEPKDGTGTGTEA